MKKLFFAMIMAMSAVGTIASADNITVVPYGRWTPLPHCGGETKLDCENTYAARQQNKCHIYFRNVYNCGNVKLYVGSDFYSNWYETNSFPIRKEFYVDNTKVNWWGKPYFNVFLSTGGAHPSKYDKVQYQFNY